MGLNDPQWGNNKNNSGPPDLEELLRKLKAQVAILLGDKGGGNKGGGGNMPKLGSGGLGLLAVIAVLIWLGSGFYIVDASQRGVVLRFGKQVDVTMAGPRWHMPYPVETVELVNLSQVRTVEVGYRENVKNKVAKESLMLTDDENIIDIQFAVQYFLRDPAEYLFNNRNSDENVRQAAETAIREVVGKNKMDFVLYEGREAVAANATKLIQEILDRYKSGIVISKLTMQNAQPPEQVQAAFDDAVKAGQDRERQKNEGQAYANDVVPRAKGTAARLIQESEGYKQSVIANAEGDASRFKQILVEYEKAPAVTRDRMYLDMMSQVMGNISKVMVDQKNGNSLLYLPLDKLIESSRTSGAAVDAPAVPKIDPVTSQGNDNNAAQRARDSLLSRDREAR
ncbi:FtsH protease activity modulator HflK [Gallionella capsiferriformans]|jgi:membrane protease subunit HflK|uniref:Protein HflK n=1 Tax=Gallionella capsiferriformans (strain ES-2) TaxID=395494 RepID=D9SFI2_GALCS|nr:FtsH protease activity modulator HflK [Gallionella capsiferriformans]ADL55279.1 HflK protein [Gallionella capsiferriformans ES-2]